MTSFGTIMMEEDKVSRSQYSVRAIYTLPRRPNSAYAVRDFQVGWKDKVEGKGDPRGSRGWSLRKE